MSESEKALSELESSRTTSKMNESFKIKENKEFKNYSNIKKSFTRYQQESDDDLDIEDQNQDINLTNKLSQNESQPDIQMIEQVKINKKSRDVSYVNSEEDYQKKIAIILSEKKPDYNDYQNAIKDIQIEKGSVSSKNQTGSQNRSHKQSIDIMSFERQSRKNNLNGNQNSKPSQKRESAKMSSKESILMSKNKTQSQIQRQESFKGFECFDNLDQYEVKLKKKQFIIDDQKSQQQENEIYFEGKKHLKSRSPSKSAGEESNQTDECIQEKQIEGKNLNKYLTVEKCISKYQSGQSLQTKNRFERQFDRQLDDSIFIQQKKYYNSKPERKMDNIKLANHNLKITQELLQKAKDKRLNALKEIDLDNEKHKQKLNDLKIKKANKSLKHDSSLKQITERSEQTQFSDSNHFQNSQKQQAKTIKWKKGESQNKHQQKSQNQNIRKDQKEQMNLSIPREDNIKKTYRWLISQYDNQEIKINLKNHSIQSSSKESKYKNFKNETVKNDKKREIHNKDSRNSFEKDVRSRSISYEDTYIRSPDKVEEYEQKLYEYQKRQLKSNQSQQIQLQNQNKQQKVVKVLNSLGLQSQFAERLYKNHNYASKNNDKIEYDKIYIAKSYSNNIRIQSPKKIEQKDLDIQLSKQNVKNQRIDEILKIEQQTQKSKFNIERISYDQFKAQTEKYPLNTQIHSDLLNSQRKPVDLLNNQLSSLQLAKIRNSISTSNKENQDQLIENKNGQIQGENIFQSYLGQSNLSMNNSQTWMPQIYAELCKSRALMAKKDIEIKKFEYDLQSKDQQLKVMEEIKSNYQSLQEVLEEQKSQQQIKERELELILIQKEEEYQLKEQEYRTIIIQKEEEFNLKEYELRSILIQREQQINAFQVQKEIEIKTIIDTKDEEFQKLCIQTELQSKQQQLDLIEVSEKLQSLLDTQNIYKNQENPFTQHIQNIEHTYYKQEIKENILEIVNKLQDFLLNIQIEINKKEKENKRALSQEIKEMEQRVEAMNQNFEQLEQQREDQEKVIDSLKQIIMLQEKLKSSEFNQFNNEIRTQVLKGIEDVMLEEQSKQMLVKLAWVSQLSEKTLSKDDNLNMTGKEDFRISQYEKLQKNQSQQTNFQENQTNDLQNIMDSQDSINAQNFDKQCREVIIQTQIEQISENTEDLGSNNSKNTQFTKKFNVLSNDIKQNMNEILNGQLKGFLQTYINEIANLKIENQKSNEKYLKEKQKVESLKQELQKKFKYQQYYENHKGKKYRNCGVQVGFSQVQNQSAIQDNSKEIFSDISNLGQSQHKKSQNFIKNKENQKGKIEQVLQEKFQKGSDLNVSQGLSSSQFSKYEYQVSNQSSIQNKNNLKIQKNRLSKSNVDQNCKNNYHSQIELINQKKQENDQELLKFQIQQNKQLYHMLKNYVQNLNKSSDDYQIYQQQQNLLNFIESTANQMNNDTIDQNQMIVQNQMLNQKKLNLVEENGNLNKSDIINNWDEFSQDENLQSIKGQNLQSSNQKSMNSGIHKSLNPTEQTVKQQVDASIEQKIINQKTISFENSQQISDRAFLPSQDFEMLQSFKYSFANKLQGLQKEIQKYNIDK